MTDRFIWKGSPKCPIHGEYLDLHSEEPFMRCPGVLPSGEPWARVGEPPHEVKPEDALGIERFEVTTCPTCGQDVHTPTPPAASE